MMMKVRHYPGHAEPVDMTAQYEASWKECDAKWRLNDKSKMKTNNYNNNSNSWSYEHYTRPPVLNNYLKANSVPDIGLNGDTRCPGEEDHYKPLGDLQPLHQNGFEPINNKSMSNSKISKTVEVLNSCQINEEPQAYPYQDFHKSKESINVERLDQIIHNPNASPLRYFNRQRVAPELIPESSQALSRRSFHVKNNVPNTLKRVKSLHVNSIKDVFEQKERKSSLHSKDAHESQLEPHVKAKNDLDAWDVRPHSLNHNKPLDLRKCDSVESVRRVTPEKNGKKTPRNSPIEIEPDYPAQTDTSNGDFIIPRPKLIVPVHTYGMRKRRTGANVSKRKGSEDVEAVHKTSVDGDKKHHSSCPGKCMMLNM